MASQVAEILITEMRLDATQYISAAKSVVAANANMTASAAAATAATNALKSAMSGMGGNIPPIVAPPKIDSGKNGGSGSSNFASFFGANLLVRAIREIEHAFITAGTKLFEFSGEALTEFSKFDTLRLSFEGVYHSSQKAAQMMNYLKDVSLVSAFTFKDLADAARGLAVSGLDVNRFLPIVQGFALAMGHIDGSGLQDFIGILRRIEGGNTGLALGPRGIGRYGVSRQELETQGARFDAKNHFVGTTEEAFRAIEGVFKSRFQAIAEKVTASSEVVMSNFKDAMQLATVDAGAGIAQNLLGPIRTLTSALNTLRQSGAMKELFDTIYQIIDVEGMLGNSGGQKGKLGAFDFQHPSDWMNGQDATRVLVEIGGGVVSIIEFLKLAVIELSDIAKLITPPWMKTANPDSLVGNALQAGEDFKLQAYGRLYLNAKDRANHPEKYGAPSAPTGNEIPGMGDVSQGHQVLRDIRDHVKSIDQQMKSSSMGGGDIARIGVTPVELSQYHHSAKGGDISRIMVDAGVAIQSAVNRAIMEAQRHAVQQGYLAGQRN